MGLFRNLFGGGISKHSCGKFWDWFTRNSKEIFRIQSGHEPILDELSQQLEKIQEHLTFEIGKAEGGLREFVISADGFKLAIPAVENLVKTAPHFEEWKIVAFRQRSNEQTAITYGAVTLRPQSIWYKSRRNGDFIDVILYVDGYIEANRTDYLACVFITLDHLLGEYVVMTQVGAIEILPTPESTEFRGLNPIVELRNEFRNLLN